MSVSAPPLVVAGEYELDPVHSRLGFAVRHAMVTKVRGHFGEFFGTARLDPDDLGTSWVQMVVTTSSIQTGQDQRDAHLRSPDFLDVETYPEMVYESTHVERLEEDRYRVHGALTIRDVTCSVPIDLVYGGVAVDPYSDQRAGFEGTATVSREAFGLTYNHFMESGGLLLGDEVALHLDVSAVRVTQPGFMR